ASPVGTSSTLSGLTCGTSYTLAVDAVDAAGNRSAKSTPLTTSTAACPATTAPSPPAGPAAAAGPPTSSPPSSAAPTNVVVRRGGVQERDADGVAGGDELDALRADLWDVVHAGRGCGRRGGESFGEGDADLEHSCVPGYDGAVGAFGPGGERGRPDLADAVVDG